MKKVDIVNANPFFLEEVNYSTVPVLDSDEYLRRIDLLLERLRSRRLTHAIIYGDREHFANIEYFTGYDPRFEEALLIIDKEGKITIIVGNEGWSYSFRIPYEINRILYQNFSLQGQPREKLKPLSKVLSEVGLSSSTKIGIIGYKYFESNHTGDPDYMFDIPAYILNSVYEIASKENVINITKELTGLPDGIRMVLRSAKEVAAAEYAAGKTANAELRMLKNLKPGISELELTETARVDFSPISVFPMINFGSEHVSLALRSPNYRILKLGEPYSICYAIRGALTSRAGIAAYDRGSYPEGHEGMLENFYMPYWEAIAVWYEGLYVGAVAGDIYRKVTELIGGPEFGLYLNTGHNIGQDEWTNSPFYKGSELRISDGSHLQCDIIASSSNPFMSAICEDGIIIAGNELRREVKAEYPEVWARIKKRQKLMRSVLGIGISDDVLPLSNINAVYWPFMLDTGKVLVFR